ncbi:MAG: hypothetical protein GY861_05525 [bacterium]|nr:hypothetical protein [bacterium]
MKKFTIDQLQDLSKVYFEKNPGLQKMLATEDGQFFYPNGDHYAYSHARNNNLNVITIRRAEALNSLVKPAEVKEVKTEAPKVETKVEKPKVDDSMTVAKINEYATENGISTHPEWDPAAKKSDKIEFINNL